MYRQKIFVFIFGFVFSLIILEIFLHILFFARYREQIHTKIETDNKVILCAGDSFTYGMGLKDGETYPSFLKRIILSNGYSDFEVVNLGILGANSHTVYKNLRRKIKFLKPDVIIFQAGISNKWNFRGFERGEHFLLKNLKILRLYFIFKDELINFFNRIKYKKNFEIIENNVNNISFETCLADMDIKNTGFELLRKYRLDEAFNFFKDKDSVTDIFGLGLTFIMKGDIKNAENTFLSIKDNYEGNIGLGYINLEAGNLNKAFKYTMNAVKTGKKDTTAYLLTADLFFRYGHDKIAESLYKKILSKMPYSYNSYIEYYEFLEENNRSTEAGELLKKAITYIKDDERIFIEMANHLLKKGDDVNCLENLNIAKKINPLNPEIYSTFSYYELLIQNGDFFEKAQNYLLKAYSMNKYDEDIIESLADLYFNNNYPDKAEKYYNMLNYDERKELVNEFNTKSKIERLGNQYLRKDVERLIEICRIRGIRFYIMNYPFFRMNSIYDIFKENKDILIDIDRKFKNLVERDKIDQYLLRDGHFNAKGAELAAETAFEHLKEQGIFE